MKTFLKTVSQLSPFPGCILLLLLCLCLPEAQATHLRGGEITVKRDTTASPNPRRIFFQLVMYTDRSSQAEDLTISVNYGAETRVTIPCGPVVQITPETDMEIFKWELTFPAAASFGSTSYFKYAAALANESKSCHLHNSYFAFLTFNFEAFPSGAVSGTPGA